jgi:hypothetical protein
MLKHLLLYSIITDFIGALGLLNFSNNTLRVPMIAVTPERLDFSIYTPERGAGGCSHSRLCGYFITLAKNFTYLLTLFKPYFIHLYHQIFWLLPS